MLLGADAGAATPAQRQAVREALLNDAGGDAWATLPGGRSGTEALASVCRIKTPPFAPVRYDTVFAMAALPAGEAPEAARGPPLGKPHWEPSRMPRSMKSASTLHRPSRNLSST